MTGLERQLTVALETLSAQYETERRRQSEQVEALGRQVERQTEQSETLQRQVERQAGRMTRLGEYYRTLAGTSRGRWI